MKVFHQRKGTTKGTCGIRTLAKIWNYSSFLFSVDNCILEAHSYSTSFELMSLTIKKQANSLSNFFLEKEFIFLNWWDLLIKKTSSLNNFFSGERVAYIFTSNAFFRTFPVLLNSYLHLLKTWELSSQLLLHQIAFLGNRCLPTYLFSLK